LRFSLDGDVIEKEPRSFDFKFLPIPWIVTKEKLGEIERLVKSTKELRSKDVKKLIKNAKKELKERRYGSCYETLSKTLNTLRSLQLIIELPKKVHLGEGFTIGVSYKNVVDNVVENLKVDLSDLKKYFDISQDVLEFPPIKRGMSVSEEVNATPKYEGLFRIEIKSESNIGEVKKEFYIKVVKRKMPFRLFKSREKKEEEDSLLDILK
jgi:hypothetical protein